MYAICDTANFHDNLLRQARFGSKKIEISDTSNEDTSTFIFSVAIKIRHKSTVVLQSIFQYCWPWQAAKQTHRKYCCISVATMVM